MSVRKLFRYSRIFYHWKIRKGLLPPLPEEVSIEATNVCNFKCAFCPQSDPNHHDIAPKTYLTPPQAEKIMQQLRKGGVTTKTLHWTLDGEPFMNKEFHELCEVAIKYGFSHMYFATNGMLLTKKLLDKLPKQEDTIYTFTIDYCNDKTYFERVRGSSGSWDRIYSNVNHSLGNSDHKHMFFVLSDISTFEERNRSIADNKFQQLTLLFGKNKRIRYHKKTFHNAAGTIQSPKQSSETKRYYLCPYPWTSFCIASSGDVVACCRDLRRQTKLGNIFEQSMQEIWHGAHYQQLRKNLVEKTPWKSLACEGCDLPYDSAKFDLANLVRTARGRLQIFGSD